MNKQELAVVVILFAVLLGWGFLRRRPTPQPPPQTEETVRAGTNIVQPPLTGEAVQDAALPLPEKAAPRPPAQMPIVPAAGEEGHAESEQIVELWNSVMRVAVSSWGGAVASVELSEYAETQQENSGPVVLDFSASPALALTGIPGLSVNNDFDLRAGPDRRTVIVSRVTSDALHFERTIRMGDDYLLTVSDVLRNDGAEVVAVAEHGMAVGPMRMIISKARTRGFSYLGIDTLASLGGERVVHWGRKKLPGLFGYRSVPFSCAKPDVSGLPLDVKHRVGQPLAWIGAKNKFFVQLLAPAIDTADGEVCAAREPESAGMAISTVWGSVIFPGKGLAPGESVRRETRYFVGPKKYALIKMLGDHQDDVMEFGWFAWLCKPLLWTLNGIHEFLPNYGVAIILLTALVRIVFWPVTHKSTESMKKMQKLQPLVSEIREKYKGNSQKMNEATMALYKEHKTNPMSGCLPMVIQIPVFIALFTVLRSAVELRFAGFLWIRDLSEPEGLLAGMVPIVGSLNILPLFMTATMVLQQQLTPTTGDPQQRKMMMIMPVVMLFIFYSMPSALVLYWSTSQCLAIVQLLVQRGSAAKEEQAKQAAPKIEEGKPRSRQRRKRNG